MPDRLLTSIRVAVRSLRAAPGLVASAVLMLALATGASVAMLGLVVRGLLAPPAGVSSPDRLFTLGFQWEDPDGAPSVMTTTSFVTFRTITDEVPGLAATAAFRRQAETLLLSGVQQQVEAVLVSGRYFQMLGARPAIGRVLEPADDSPSSLAVVLSHAFWRSAFGGNPDVIRQRVNIGGIEYTIVGVMPALFSGHSSDRVDVWIPLGAAMQGSPGWEHDAFRHIISIAVRIGDRAGVAAVSAQASAALGTTVVLRPVGAGAGVSAVERQIAVGLTALSLLVVILALANTATLLLVRGAARRRDAAIRAALGATRARLVAHITIEALVLATVTGALSLLMALWFEEGVRRVLLPNLAAGHGLNSTAILAACAAALLAAVVAAAAGAVQLPSTSHADGMSGGYLMGDRRGVLQRVLLVIQVGVSVVLLAGLGMFGRSLYNLGAQDFGFRMDGVLMVDFPPAPGRHEQSAVFAETIERVRMLPGVERATFIQGVPFASFHVPPIGVPGLAEPPQVGQQLPYLIAATPDFLDIMGVEIVEGRSFTPQDDRGAPVVIVNQSMARGAWPGESAVGKCIRIGFGPDFDPFTASGPPEPPLSLPCREVIGVARDVRQRSVVPSGNEDRLMQYYVPFSQVPPPPAAVGPGPGVRGLLVRATGNVDVVAAALRKTIVSGRTDLPFLRVRTYRDILGAQMRPWLLGTQLLGIFAALALVVASVGLYAAFAHAVSIRRREMAIRLAVGARRALVVRLVLGDALRIAGIGVLLGCAGAAFAGRWAAALLFGTSPTDPFVLSGASVVMVAVAAAATLLPARTASRTNPTDLLKSIQ